VKRFTLLVLLLAFSFGISACSQGESSASPTEARVVEDQADLLAALRDAGATVDVVDSVDQIFFSPQGSIISVNGADVQVFEYESSEAMEAEAAQVAPDGGSIGTSMVTWVDVPHFYKTGRVIVLYVGSDAATLGLLETVIGSQFAGR
jgi:hypothetical protein